MVHEQSTEAQSHLQEAEEGDHQLDEEEHYFGTKKNIIFKKIQVSKAIFQAIKTWKMTTNESFALLFFSSKRKRKKEK